MKNKTSLHVILIMLLFLTLACSLLGSKNTEESAVVEEPAAVEQVEVPTEPAPTEVPPTAVPPTAVPPTEVPPTKVPPTPKPTSAPTWRMAPPDGSFLVIQDTDNDPQWEEIAAMHAANLAIPAPYYYELYVLRNGIKFNEVKDHYVEEMGTRKYTIARSEQGANEMYLMTFLYSLDKTSKNAVLFYAQLSNRDPLVLVIYSNPVEN
jgi:hypothetical protein